MPAPESRVDGSMEIISEGLKCRLPRIEALSCNSFLFTNNLTNGHVARADPMLAPPVSSISNILICSRGLFMIKTI